MGKNFYRSAQGSKSDAGEGIRRGAKTIVWDALKEMPFIEDTMTFQVRAVKQPVKKKFFVTLEGNTITWLGLRAGMLGKSVFMLNSEGTRMLLKKVPSLVMMASSRIIMFPGIIPIPGKMDILHFLSLVGSTGR